MMELSVSLTVVHAKKFRGSQGWVFSQKQDRAEGGPIGKLVGREVCTQGSEPLVQKKVTVVDPAIFLWGPRSSWKTGVDWN